MTFSSFFKYIKIETNLTSAMPAILGFLFSYWYFGRFDWFVSLLFFLALMLVSAFVTAWNSLMDYLKATNDSYRKTHNQLTVFNISVKEAFLTCSLLMLGAIGLGIWLITLTNWLLLLLGGLCILVTIFYTFSPFAFSRMPLGEILAGMVEGLGSFWLACWVNNWDGQLLMLNWDVRGGSFSLVGNLWTFLLIVIAGLATAVFNFNIMMADNICDLDQDITNKRFTLPYYLGKKHSLGLMRMMYLLAFFLLLISSLIGTLPITVLLVFFSIPLLRKNNKKFQEKQIKSETFPLIIQNLPVFEGLWMIGMILGILFLRR
jgi:1,4-dihydroxy-2-naphthoate octaprenyltransferase